MYRGASFFENINVKTIQMHHISIKSSNALRLLVAGGAFPSSAAANSSRSVQSHAVSIPLESCAKIIRTQELTDL